MQFTTLYRIVTCVITLFSNHALASLPADYFNVTYSQYYEQMNTPYAVSLSASLYDPITKTGATCFTKYSPGRLPGSWITCDNAQFYMKIDAYSYPSTWTLEFKHQYTGAGKKCSLTHGDDCTTARAYMSFNEKTTPGFSLGGSATGSYDTFNYHEPGVALVFVRCGGGCGTTTGVF